MNKSLIKITSLFLCTLISLLTFSSCGQEEIETSNIKEISSGQMSSEKETPKLKKGQIIEFGKWDLYTGYYIDDLEDIRWRVIDVENNKALIIMYDEFLSMPYQDEKKTIISLLNTPWSHCTLRNWLNNDFFNQAFTTEEQKKILTTSISIPDYEIQMVGSLGPSDKTYNELLEENNTDDKIFILSTEEYSKYFHMRNDESEIRDSKMFFRIGNDYITEYIGGYKVSERPSYICLRDRDTAYEVFVIDSLTGTPSGVDFGTSYLSDDFVILPAMWIEID